MINRTFLSLRGQLRMLVLIALCVAAKPGISQTLASHQGPPCYPAGGTIRITNALTYSGSLLSLLLRPALPSGWTVESVTGDGTPELLAGEIVWTGGSLPASPVDVIYVVGIPTTAVGTKQIRSEWEYLPTGLFEPISLFANPNPLQITDCATAAAASAKHQAPCYLPGGTLWVTNSFTYSGSLLSLLLRPALPTGWTVTRVAGDGNPDLQAGEIVWTGTSLPASPVDVTYLVSIPANAAGTQQIRDEWEYLPTGLNEAIPLFATPNPLAIPSCVPPTPATANHKAPCYPPGGTFWITNSFTYADPLLSMLLRPALPAGWTVTRVAGDGNPELLAGDIVWTGTSLPASPIKVAYEASVPAGAVGPKEIRDEWEYLPTGLIEPLTIFATPDPLRIASLAPPIITCPVNITLQCDQPTDPATTGQATATGNTGVITWQDQPPQPGSCPNAKTITRTWTATNECGIAASCVQRITVVDTIAPTISCAAVAGAIANASCQAPIPTVTTISSDNCSGPVTVSQEPAAGTPVSRGTHTITVTARDACGNIARCTSTFSVTDNTPPTATCPTVPGATADTTCQALIPTVTATASDACPGTVTVSQEPVAGTPVGLGNHTITLTATDAAGNSSSCTTTFTVTDNTPPTVTCPTVPGATADATCQALIPTVTATASDACPGTVTVSQEPVAGTPVGLGTHTITLTATDAAGNSARCTTTFAVTDNSLPTVSCPPGSNAPPNTNGQAPVPNVLGGVTAADACDRTLSLSQNPAVGTLVGLGLHTITVTATDDAGNSATCTTTFLVSKCITDNEAPIVNCTAVPGADANASCAARIPAVTATASDACPGTVTVSQEPVEGTPVGLGNHTITLTATDAAGNSATCTTTFKVTDATAPVLSGCPANVTVECDAIPELATPSATDNCDSHPTILLVETATAGSCAQARTISRKWTATDAAGNAVSCTQQITVMDTTRPSITCAASKTVECGQAWSFNAPTASDTCGTATVAIVGTVTNAACGNTFAAMRTWRATDACGNTANCSQTVTVVDTTPPTIVCPANITVQGAGAVPPPNVASVGVTDNCDTTPTVIHVGDVTNSAMTLVSRTYRATDDCNNAAACVQSITIAPVAPICGDLNHDGAVDSNDYYLVFRGALRKCRGQLGFNAEADYDGDGCITLGDYQWWYVCYKAFLNRP